MKETDSVSERRFSSQNNELRHAASRAASSGRMARSLFRRKPTATGGGTSPHPSQKAANITGAPDHSGWDSLPFISPGIRKPALNAASLIDFYRNDTAAQAFDDLRTNLLQTLAQMGRHRIAVVSPTPGCGSTFTTLNLGLSFARVANSRTVIMDLNQRAPGLAAALGMRPAGDMTAFLRGDIPVQDHLRRAGDTLALALTAKPGSQRSDILHDPRSAETLNRMSRDLTPNVVLCDLPPMLAYDDLMAFLPQVAGVLIVADSRKTRPDHIAACEEKLKGKTKVFGVILNCAPDFDMPAYDA